MISPRVGSICKGGRRAKAVVTLALLANLVACAEYVPVRGSIDVMATPQVRVTLTDQGATDVASRIGQRARRLEGVLLAMTDSSLTLSVRKVSREGGIEDSYAGEQLTLATPDFDAVEQGRTSVRRSLLLAGGVVAGALLIAKGAGDLSGGGSGKKPPPTR